MKNNAFAPVLFIGNAYRRQLFQPFLESQLFGKRPYIYLESTRILKKTSMDFLLYHLLKDSAAAVFISDAEGAQFLEQEPLPKNKKILWFCWNGADDVKEWNLSKIPSYSDLKIYFLFSDETKKCQELFKIKSAQLKFPILEKFKVSAEKKYLISYLGETDAVEELSSQDPEMHKYLWELTDKVLSGQSFSAGIKFIDKSRVDSSKTSFSKFVWILKNRIRLRYIEALKQKFGKDFALVGNDWKKYGIDSLPADFNEKSRFELYANSKFCLDLLSKSTLEGHYPRPAEIISHNNGILQLQTIDSQELFGDQCELRTFDSISDLEKKIEHFSQMSEDEFDSLGQILRTRLANKTQEFNLAQLS